MLVLFDIDSTLLQSNGAGGDAFIGACEAVIGQAIRRDSVEFAGGTDSVLFRRLLEIHGVSYEASLESRFRAMYRERLEARLSEGDCVALPGVFGLLDSLRSLAGVTTGLLTGNYADTAALKLRSARIDPDLFPMGAFGNDGATRRDLPAVAMDRYRAAFGEVREGDQVVVIGDTPLDVDCAKHAGCRALGVATGPFDRAALLDCGADYAVCDLTDTAAIVRWLVGS